MNVMNDDVDAPALPYTIAEYKQHRADWLAALRSGDYRQGNGHLVCRGGGMCCLGVAGAVMGLEPMFPYDTEEGGFWSAREDARLNGNATPEIVDWLGLSSNAGFLHKYVAVWLDPFMVHYQSIAEMNDSGHYTFMDMANFIACNPPGLWAEGTF